MMDSIPNEELAARIAQLPTQPGIYQYKNADGKIIYVGKARNLRSRVRSYFQSGRPMDAKTKALIRVIADIEIIVTDTEAEALLLENNLIKEHKPKYNILLKDDKTYPYIRITNEEFPRLFSTRHVVRDGSRYFGPYTDGKYLSYLLRTLRSLFPLRSCDLPLTESSIAQNKFKVCLDYHIKKCEGPCQAFSSREQYNAYIRQAVQVLNGRTRELEMVLEKEMMQLSEEMRFEQAMAVRNRLLLLREYTGKQKVISPDLIDRDVFALASIDDDACVLALTVRDGKMLGKRHYFVAQASSRDPKDILYSVLGRHYAEQDMIPDEIFLPFELEGEEYELQWLSEKKGGAVLIHIPKIGDKKKLVSMAHTNAEFLLREMHLQQAAREQALPRGVASLQKDLSMAVPPRRIECFDNSHMQGTDYVSSMVVFIDGRPKKSEYRKFKIRSFTGNDDFAAMREVVQRRYSRVIAEGLPMPDLIIIDGGKGQLSSAMEILTSLGLHEKVKVIGLAKRLEEVFLPAEPEPVLLPRTSTSLRLLQSLRDEAHRFAITYHRQLRDKRTLHTELLEISGIGQKTADMLLREFGSVKGILQAGSELIEKKAGKKTARILEEWRNSLAGKQNIHVHQEHIDAPAPDDEEFTEL
jgi:excinuclease ABC subunit C